MNACPHAADDVAVALLVDNSQIARVHPAACIDHILRPLGITQYPRITL